VADRGGSDSEPRTSNVENAILGRERTPEGEETAMEDRYSGKLTIEIKYCVV
jgi:hypothetical protein